MNNLQTLSRASSNNLVTKEYKIGDLYIHHPVMRQVAFLTATLLAAFECVFVAALYFMVSTAHDTTQNETFSLKYTINGLEAHFEEQIPDQVTQ